MKSANKRVVLIVSVVVGVLAVILAVGLLLYVLIFAPAAEDVYANRAAVLDLRQQADGEAVTDNRKYPVARYAWLSPGSEYLTAGDERYEQACEQIDRAVSFLQDSAVNTLVVPVFYNGRPIAEKAGRGKPLFEEDLYEYILSVAGQRGWQVYPVYTLQMDVFAATGEQTNEVLTALESFVQSYDCDGLVLDAAAPAPDEQTYTCYLQSGIPDFTDYQQIAQTALVNRAIKTVKAQDAMLYCGVLAGGQVDPQLLCTQELVDFIMTDSLTSGLDRWEQAAADTQVDVFQTQDASQNQWPQTSNMTGLSGVAALYDTPERLTAFFGAAGQTALSLALPEDLQVQTFGDEIVLLGMSDPAQPLTINGETVQRGAAGGFRLRYKLSDETNTLVVENGTSRLTVTIQREQQLLWSVPSVNRTVQPGGQVMVSVVAPEGTRLTAALGDQQISLRPATDNSIVSGAEIERYTGTFAVSDVEAPQTADIVLTAKKSGEQQQVILGNVTVNPVQQENWNTVATVVTEQAEVLKGGVADDKSRPEYTPLPAGTVDYCKEDDMVLYADGEALYYKQMRFGGRLYADTDRKGENVSAQQGQLPDTNSVTALEYRQDQRHMVLTLDTRWKAPFQVAWLPQSYQDPQQTDPRPDYTITAAEYTHIDITFYYAVSAQGKIDLHDDDLFSAMEWIRQENSYVLRLHLRRQGAFYGYHAAYDEQGRLEFRFLRPYQCEAADHDYGVSLSGAVIMLDAGHGGADPGAVNADGTIRESELNLLLAQQLQQELEKLGATVIMTRTDETEVTLEQRTQLIREHLPDIFVSLHRNASESEGATGYENYYYYPFSKALSDAIYNRSVNLLNGRGQYYYPFYVTRVTECPAILTENGYVSTQTEAQQIADPAFNRQLAQEITAGIVDYFKALQIS